MTVLVPGGGRRGLAVGQSLAHAQSTYGPDAQPLLPLTAPDPDLAGEPDLVPLSGALATGPADPSGGSIPYSLSSPRSPALEQNVGPLLNTAQVPFRVVGPDSDLNFDPHPTFSFRTTGAVTTSKARNYIGRAASGRPLPPSDPATAPYRVNYTFHPFYHAFTRPFLEPTRGRRIRLLYDLNLQQNPDQIDPSGADVFSFNSNYSPTSQRLVGPRRRHRPGSPVPRFRLSATFSVYNWELFYHIPLYIAQLLSQNQQFEDAQTWFHYIFNPTRQGSDPVPQRFWIPKPLHNLTSAQILVAADQQFARGGEPGRSHRRQRRSRLAERSFQSVRARGSCGRWRT